MADTNEIIGILDDTSDMTGTLDGDLIRGYSAYEIYLENGGTLSEEEWLESLHGADGHTPEITSEKVGTREHKLYADGVEFASVFDGFDGTDGHTPEITASKTGNTTTISVDGTDVAEIVDGEKGDPGDTPEITAERSGTDTTIYADGTSIAVIHDGQDGDPGQDGVSPSATVTQTANGATITITDKTGTTTATISNGQPGSPGEPGEDGHTPEKGVDYWTAQDKASIVSDVLNSQEISQINQDISDLSGTVSGKYTKPANGIPASDFASGVIPDVSGKADKVNGATSGNFASLDANGNLTDSGHKHSDYLTEAPVTDVQTNGTSVLNQGVAEIPIAGSSTPGVVKVSGKNGLWMTSSGLLSVSSASVSEIKSGAAQYAQLTPSHQHDATFYGLAKAAGDATQSASSNAVGTYTEEAKQAIRQMLGLPKNIYAEVINDITTEEDLTVLTINTDSANNLFALRKARVAILYPVSTTGETSYISAEYLNGDSDNYVNFGTAQLLGSVGRFVFHDYEAVGGYAKVEFYYSSGSGNSANFGGSVGYLNLSSHTMTGFRLYRYNNQSSATLVPKGTHIVIIGIRE